MHCSNVTHLDSLCLHRVVLSFAVCSEISFADGMDSKLESLDTWKSILLEWFIVLKRFASAQFPWKYKLFNCRLSGLQKKFRLSIDPSVCLSIRPPVRPSVYQYLV